MFVQSVLLLAYSRGHKIATEVINVYASFRFPPCDELCLSAAPVKNIRNRHILKGAFTVRIDLHLWPSLEVIKK